MNAVFADTSALLALLNADDQHHSRAKRAFAAIRARRALLVSTSYVLVETYALVGRRLGREAVKSFRADMAPLLDVIWVDAATHDAGLDLLADRRTRMLSLVDAVSFVTMRRQQIAQAFAFDRDFGDEGFTLVG